MVIAADFVFDRCNIIRPSLACNDNHPLLGDVTLALRPSISTTVTTVPMGSLHTSFELSSLVSLHSAPGWITTLYFAGNFTSVGLAFALASPPSSTLSTLSLASVLVLFEWPLGL